MIAERRRILLRVGAICLIVSFFLGVKPVSAVEIKYGQWLGAEGWTIIRGMALSGDELYVAGWENTWGDGSVVEPKFETLRWFGTRYYQGQDFLIEFKDGGLNWGLWLGGDRVGETVEALAVEGNEIYVAGYAGLDPWAGYSFSGSPSGAQEAFVLEVIDDDASDRPVISWAQWLGGSGKEEIEDIAVDGDNIYAVGTCSDNHSWDETATYRGNPDPDSRPEGFVVKLIDNPGGGLTHRVRWVQWLGSDISDTIRSVALNGNYVYVGGTTYNSSGQVAGSNWEDSLSGVYGGEEEGWVAKIQDNGTFPTVRWIQFIGGDRYDRIFDIAANGNEIYATGYCYNDEGWQSDGFGSGDLFGSCPNGTGYGIFCCGNT